MTTLDAPEPTAPQAAWIFTRLAGALLLALAAVLLIASFASSAFVHPRDPIFGLAAATGCWISGAVLLAVGLFSLFGRTPSVELCLIAWLALNFWLARAFLPWLGVKGGFRGYMGPLTETFNLPASTSTVIIEAAFACLLAGSSVLLSLAPLTKALRRFTLVNRLIESLPKWLKMPCPACGGHIQFFFRNLGQTTPCPHCRAAITLRGCPTTSNDPTIHQSNDPFARMSCFFCKGHIEFPPHAIGQKIPCPHCRMDITLKEPAL
jgi:hypothetical protein